jgi:hypothetical protein
MAPQLTDIVIPKEKAVFWMDAQGHWHNRHGRFGHKRIVDYFNRSIRRDANGYFVSQIRDEIRERVYFHYDDTPLFAVRVVDDGAITLVLNTGETILLDPSGLFVQSDQLYQRRNDERIKFTDRALLSLSAYLAETENGLAINIGGQHFPIAAR